MFLLSINLLVRRKRLDYRRVWAVLYILIMRNDHIDIESLSRGLMNDYRTLTLWVLFCRSDNQAAERSAEGV